MRLTKEAPGDDLLLRALPMLGAPTAETAQCFSCRWATGAYADD